LPLPPPVLRTRLRRDPPTGERRGRRPIFAAREGAYPAKGTNLQLKPQFLLPQYWPTWLGLAFLRIVERLPYPATMFVGRAVGRIARRLAVPYVRVARRNIELCLPQLTQAERRDLLDEHFLHLGMSLCESAMSWWSDDERIRGLSKVEGLENLQRARAAGRGIILLTSHFTTLEIGARILSSETPINVLYRPLKNQLLAAASNASRERHARRAIQRDDIRTMIRALKENEIVWYAPDQSYRKKGAQMVPFFGIPAASNTFTSRLAQMTGAAVLTFSHERLPDSKGYRVVINPQLEGFPSGDAVADTERFHHFIEGEVRRNPEQFWWIHRRFKGLSPDYPDYYAAAAPTQQA
jgi:KDO2-lipid IV(A) lauroyltransferase